MVLHLWRLVGLGIGSLKALNFSLLSKWLWRWHTEKDALWNHILHSIHGAKGGDFLNYASIDIKGTWYDILKACHDVNSLNIPLSSFYTRSISEGVSIKFWDEEWLGTFKLAEVYPRLYALESMKDCNIADRLFKSNGHISLAWNWRRCIRGGREKEEMDSLTCLIQGVELKSGPDGWNWALESSGKFTVKSLRKYGFVRFKYVRDVESLLEQLRKLKVVTSLNEEVTKKCDEIKDSMMQREGKKSGGLAQVWKRRWAWEKNYYNDEISTRVGHNNKSKKNYKKQISMEGEVNNNRCNISIEQVEEVGEMIGVSCALAEEGINSED
ncbi:RNA-directed DNA polymerase, eukaryota, Reverse transcriptase zinc-binding domain protein [Artemisia annua]|uniref:RNA-directed DNA polymerase, eukaryota, Reverse transcriptase zinc-binding domain protein n=1 Tax=Artemisia annua TaxID=35608 RepID=A0A2U1L2N4_ARTAN|nr:RNA-directed DNA polymerase, eukaryota, Reverse transcriptase zinc-binding domain protein [Artemisia annua]